MLAAALPLLVLSCTPPPPTPSPTPPPTPTPTPPPTRVTELSGCETEKGAWVVALPINLTMVGSECRASIPALSKKVCVRQGGLVVWVVETPDCTIDKPLKTALEISKPKGQATGKTLALGCTRKLAKVLRGKTSLLACGIPDDADEDTYRYSVGGEVVPDDPDIEVRKGG
jgi:hypothetical protein